jgi:hypothetical protein
MITTNIMVAGKIQLYKDPETIILLKFNNNLNDESRYNRSIEYSVGNGIAPLTYSSVSNFGDKSLQIVFPDPSNPTTSNYQGLGFVRTDMNATSGTSVQVTDMTIEAWLYRQYNIPSGSLTPYAALFAQFGLVRIAVNETQGKFSVTGGAGAPFATITPGTFPIGWFHLCVTRKGSVWYLHINGNLVTTLADPFSGSEIYVASNSAGPAYTNIYGFMADYMDEFRFSSGVRYDVNGFTPSNLSFT